MYEYSRMQCRLLACSAVYKITPCVSAWYRVSLSQCVHCSVGMDIVSSMIKVFILNIQVSVGLAEICQLVSNLPSTFMTCFLLTDVYFYKYIDWSTLRLLLLFLLTFDCSQVHFMSSVFGLKMYDCISCISLLLFNYFLDEKHG